MALEQVFPRWAHPEAIAIVGASADPTTIGGRPLVYLQKHGYPGQLYPVNPKYAEVQGIPAFKNVTDIPGPVDVAIVAVGAKWVPSVLEQCATKGVGVAVVLSSGFAETGGDGISQQQRLADIARGSGMRILGPNCQGYLSLAHHVAAGFSLALEFPMDDGDLGLISQSGALGFSIYNQMNELGERFRYVTSTGNEVDLTVADIMELYLLDPEVRRVMVYLEGVRDSRRLLSVFRRASDQGVPVVVLKGGRTPVGEQAALSHTAALTGGYEVFQAAMEKANAIVVDDIVGAREVLDVLRMTRTATGFGVGIVSTSGGAGVLMADAVLGQGFSVPALSQASEDVLATVIPPFGSVNNPVDVTAQVITNPASLVKTVTAVDQDAHVSLLIIVLTMIAGAVAKTLTDAFLDLVQDLKKPVFFLWTASRTATLVEENRFREAGLPLLRSPGALAMALAHWHRWHQGRLTLSPIPAELSTSRGEPDGGSQPGTMRVFNEWDAKLWLKARGLPIVSGEFVETAPEATRVAMHYGFPVVVKGVSRSVSHKSDWGLVAVGLLDADAVEAAARRILTSAREAGIALDGLLVEEQVQGIEMALGMVQDPVFGPAVLVGSGGVLMELYRDVSHGLPPLDRPQARRLLERLKAWRLLTGFRGKPPADTKALISLMCDFSRVVVREGNDLAEVDLNPVMVRQNGQGVVIVDAVMRWRG